MGSPVSARCLRRAWPQLRPLPPEPGSQAEREILGKRNECLRFRHVRVGVIWIARDGSFRKLKALAEGADGEARARCGTALQKQILRDCVGGSSKLQRQPSCAAQRDTQRVNNVCGDIGLYFDSIARRAIVALSPALNPIRTANKLCVDTDHLRRAADTACQDVGNAKFRRRCFGVEVLDSLG